MALLAETKIPVIAPRRELHDHLQDHSMTVKTQPQDTDKIPVIKRLITEHVNLKKLLAAC